MVYYFYQKNIEVQPIFSNEEEWRNEFNRQLQESRVLKEQFKKIEAKNLLWNSVTNAQSKIITFYGKVIDQHGESVVNAQVKYSATSPMAESSGNTETRTNEQGLFVVTDARGALFHVEEVIKPGYEAKVYNRGSFYAYQRFPDSQKWTDYTTPETAYVFDVWKINNGYPITSHTRTTYSFELGKIYSMNFNTSNKKEVKHLGQNNALDLQVLFERDDGAETWNLTLTVPDGGLLESQDLYMNFAPEGGYDSIVMFNGTRKDHMIPKSFYIKSRGNTYGRLLLEIRPYMKIGSALGIDHVMNLEQGLNLEIKK